MKQKQIDALLIPFHHYLWPSRCWSTAGSYTRLMERFMQIPGITTKDLVYTRVKHWIEQLPVENESTRRSYKGEARLFFRWFRSVLPFAMIFPIVVKVLARFPTKPVCDFCVDKAEGTTTHRLDEENGEVVCDRCFAVYSIWMVEPLFQKAR